MREYTKIKITANALVPRGAVQEKAIFKDANVRVQLTDIVKAEDKQIMYSIMFPLNKEDSQGCIVKKPEVLEQAARDFMKEGAKNLKILHDGEFTDGAEYQELWIVKAGDPIFNQPHQVGALANAIYFPNKELFQKMKSEGWETSIEGQAEEVEIEKDAGFISRIAKAVKELFNKEQEQNMPMPTMEELKPIVEEIVKPMLEALKAELKPEEKPIEEAKPEEEDEMKKSLSEMQKSIEDMKKENKTLLDELKKSSSQLKDVDGKPETKVKKSIWE